MAFTKDKFLTDIRTMNKNNAVYTDKAFDSIVSNLFILNKWGKEKAMGLDEYNSEQNSNVTLIPGHIYAFKYITNTPTKYDDGKTKFEYYDSLPIVLCTSISNGIIQGINLNLCTYDLRTLILNDIYNIDPDFINTSASLQAHLGQIPISKNIQQFFLRKENQTKFLQYLKDRYKLKNTGIIFRTYSVEKIKQIRFIEPWQWKYIPFINYKSSVKEPILHAIHNITGIDKIKI